MKRPPCFECGKPSDNDHHVVPRSRGGTKTVPLCVNCHGKAHGVTMASRDLTREALARMKAKGQRTGGIPYGWDLGKDGRSLVRNAVEQRAIGLVKRLRSDGMSCQGIANEMNGRSIKTKAGNNWHETTVRRVLAPTGNANAPT